MTIQRLRPIFSLPAQVRRYASTAAEADTPSEGFGTGWIQAGVVLVAGYGLYKVERSSAAKDPEKKSPITRYIEGYMTPPEEVKAANNHILATVSKMAGDKLLFAEAKRPAIHRLTYPESFEIASPHCLAPGSTADLSNLKVKTEHEDRASS